MSGGQVPNDLLDQRDQLIHQVNKYIQTSQVAGDNGQISLFICNSMPVVLGSKPATLSVGYDSFNNTNKSKLSYSLGGTSTTELNEDFMGGGEITGLLKFQNKDLVDATNLLGRMALAIGTVLNNQQALGVDPNGNAGSNLYNIASIPNALSKSSNTGTASIAVTVQSSPSGATSFKASDYQLDYNGATWTATRTLDGVTTNLSAAPYNFPTAPANLDGLTFTLSSGTAASGDSFFARPFATTASNISTAFATTQGLAMASPVAASAGVSNKGTLTLQSLSALSALGTIPVTPVTLTFTNTGSSYTYTRSDGLPFVPNNTYTPGTAISYNAGGTGWSVTLKGIPQTGDTVIIGRNSNFSLDAGNAQAVLDLRDLTLFDGLRPLTDGYASLVAAVGVKVQSAQSAQQISTDISASLDKQKTSISGVNLDEEAARMLQYQQAYQAAGKMMQIAQSIFQTLLQGLG
jgi:flagellar hook-associated protein 1 FlgK